MTDDILNRFRKLIEEEEHQKETGLISRPTAPQPPMEQIELIEYPLGSKEHPFDLVSKGQYFVHMCNRDLNISYLGDDLEDFSEFNDNMYKTIPMGYASLWIMQRTYLIDKTGIEYNWESNKLEKDISKEKDAFYLFDPKGALRHPDIINRVSNNQNTKIFFETQNDAREFARKAIDETDYPILCGLRLASYSWH